MQGYWNLPEATAAALTPEGWYRSGDMAYSDKYGYLYIVDRVKDMIVSGGENIYSTEVELALYDYAGVREAAVFGVPDPKWGERVHAVVVMEEGCEAASDELIAHVRGLIAGYKAPRSVELRTEPMPKSAAGKILKRELRDPYWVLEARQVS